MPFWSFEQERLLEDMVNQNKPIEEIAEHFRRSVEAVKLKIRRLGLHLPKSLETESDKLSPGTPIEPVSAEELPSAMEALQLLWSAVQRLKEPDVSAGDVKKIRLMVSSIKAYASLHSNYLLRLEKMEQSLLLTHESNKVHLKVLLEHEKDPAKKAEIEALIKELEEDIASMKAGPQVPAKLKTGNS